MFEKVSFNGQTHQYSSYFSRFTRHFANLGGSKMAGSNCLCISSPRPAPCLAVALNAIWEDDLDPVMRDWVCTQDAVIVFGIRRDKCSLSCPTFLFGCLV